MLLLLYKIVVPVIALIAASAFGGWLFGWSSGYKEGTDAERARWKAVLDNNPDMMRKLAVATFAKIAENIQ